MVRGRYILIVLIFIAVIFASLIGVKCSAENTSHLFISFIDCPPEVYAGDSFMVRLTVLNNDSVSSHKYALILSKDHFYYSTLSGRLEPNSTANFTLTFAFSTPGQHSLNFTLFEDELFTKPSDEKKCLVSVVSTEISLQYLFDTSPIYPGDSFTLKLYILNAGSKSISNTRVYVYPTVQPYGITLNSPSVSDLGSIPSYSLKTLDLSFNVSDKASFGVYPLRIAIEYDDAYSYHHKKFFGIPVEIFSNDLPYKCDSLDALLGSISSRMSQLENAVWNNITYVTIVLILMIIAVCVTLYYEIRQLTKKLNELRRTLRKR